MDTPHSPQPGNRSLPGPAPGQIGDRSRSGLRPAGLAAPGREDGRRRNREPPNRKRRADADRDAAARTARSGDDALLRRAELQGNRRADRREHQHRAGTDALCAHQPAAHDQGKKSGSVLSSAQYSP